MLFVVFSFNRGKFLRHCINSIEEYAPGHDIVIFDDNSNDAETLSVLDDLGRTHTIRSSQDRGEHKHGGLYNNMQIAFDSIECDRLFCFMQDDMQLVRTLTAEDEQQIESYFHRNNSAGFLQPCFLKGSSRERDVSAMKYDHKNHTYFRQTTSQSAGIHYSDVFISIKSRLASVGWKFRQGEPANEENARQHFNKMGHMFTPFLMWLPAVPSYRGKKKTFALKLAEKKHSCGFYPFTPLTNSAIAELRSRSPQHLPFAEDYLKNTNEALSQPWTYHPLQGSNMLRKINSVELALARMFSKLRNKPSSNLL